MARTRTKFSEIAAGGSVAARSCSLVRRFFGSRSRSMVLRDGRHVQRRSAVRRAERAFRSDYFPDRSVTLLADGDRLRSRTPINSYTSNHNGKYSSDRRRKRRRRQVGGRTRARSVHDRQGNSVSRVRHRSVAWLAPAFLRRFRSPRRRGPLREPRRGRGGGEREPEKRVLVDLAAQTHEPW